MGACLTSLILLGGCSQTSTVGPPSSLAPLLPTFDTTTTSTTLLLQPDLIGYAINVLDGHTFDLQVINGGVTRLTIGNIAVPDIGTCEGTEARSLLARLIAGKQVRVDPAGIVWLEDIDVAMAMVSYGRAKSAGERYQAADAQSEDFNCAATTTTTIQEVVLQPQPTTKPTTKPTKPRPKPTAPPRTEPVETPAAAPAAAPAATPAATPPRTSAQTPVATPAATPVATPAATVARPVVTDSPETVPAETKPPKPSKPPKSDPPGSG